MLLHSTSSPLLNSPAVIARLYIQPLTLLALCWIAILVPVYKHSVCFCLFLLADPEMEAVFRDVEQNGQQAMFKFVKQNYLNIMTFCSLWRVNKLLHVTDTWAIPPSWHKWRP